MRQFMDRLESRRMFDAGQIDTTFGTNGHTELTAPNSPYDIVGVDIDSTANGQVYVTGATSLPNDLNVSGSTFVWRLRPDGSIDESFSTDGLAELPGGGYSISASHLVATSDGGALVQVGGQLIYKLTQKGKLDQSFGRKGKIDLSGVNVSYEIAADTQGRIYAPGQGADGKLLIRRFNADGSLDPTYGTGGTFTPPGN